MPQRSAMIGLSAALLAFGLLASLLTTLFADSFMALTAGQHIVHHGFGGTDPFTVEGAGRAWVDQQWLAHVAFFGAWKIAGYPGVTLVSAAAIAAGVGMLAALLARLGMRGTPIFSWIAIVLLAGIGFAFPRSQNFAYPLAVGCIWLLVASARRTRAGWRDLALVAVLVVWANVHGSVLLAAPPVAVWQVWRAWRAWRAHEPWVHVALLACAGVASALSVLATPYATATIGYYRDNLANPVIAKYVAEWRPLQPTSPFDDLLLALVVVVAVLLVRAGRGRGAFVPALLALGWVTAASVLHIRHSIWVPIVAAVAVATLGIGTAAGPVGVVSARDSRRGVRVRAAALLLGVVAAALAIVRVSTLAPEVFLRTAPVASIDRAAQLLDHRPTARVIADDASAAALLWLHPQVRRRIAFDARLEQFPRRRLEAFYRFERGLDAQPQRFATGYDVAVFHRDDARGARALERSGAWHMVERAHGDARNGYVLVRN